MLLTHALGLLLMVDQPGSHLFFVLAPLLLLSRAAALTVNAVQPSATEQLKEDNPGVTLNTTSLENDPVSQMLVPEVGQMEQSLYGRR